MRANSTGPGFAMNLGPRGPSIVNAAICPPASTRFIPSSAPAPPRELDPRTAINPNRSMIRAMYSPSKLRLVITATPRPRKYQVAGITARCQKGPITNCGGPSPSLTPPGSDDSS